MEVFGMSLPQLLLVIVFIVVGGWVVWKIFMKLIHLVIFIAACLILVYIYQHVPAIHSVVSSLI